MEENNEVFDLNNLLVDGQEQEDEGFFNPFDNTEENEEEDIENNDNNSEEELDSKPKKNIAEEKSPENVGNDEEEESTFVNNDGSSPKIYSSIAKVLKEEGTFPDLKDEDLDKIKDSDSFIEVIQNQIRESIDEEYRRINSALNVGVQPNVINSYRNSIKYLDSLTEDAIKDENNVELRKTLIMQDMMNRGYSKERAEKHYQKSYDSGEEIDDALEALEANKEFFNQKYNELLDDADRQEKAIARDRQQRIENFKKSIMEDKNLYGDFEVTKQMRQSIYDSLTKPIYTDKQSGQTYTAVQKWQLDDPDAFNKALGLIYHLTNGGKDFKGLIKGEVKKNVSKARNEFESAIRNTSAFTSNGKLRLGNAHEDTESYLKGYTLQI